MCIPYAPRDRDVAIRLTCALLVLGQIIEITWLTCVEASIQVPHGLTFNREKA